MLALKACEITASLVLNDNLVVFSAENNNEKMLIAYEWDFGDRTYGRGLEVSHLYEMPGDYTVSCNSKTADKNDFCETSLAIPVNITKTSIAGFEIKGKIDIAGTDLDYGSISLF